MYEQFGQACATAREKASLTQEQAEPVLHIGARSISDYERGRTLPGDETVLLMMEKYNAPELGYLYLRCNKVGQMLLPEIPTRLLSSSILDLQIEMKHTLDLQNDIAEVGRDNRVDESELPRWQQCVKELRELAGSIFSVLLVPLEKKVPPI